MTEYVPRFAAVVYISQSEFDYADTPDKRKALVDAKAAQMRLALLTKWEDACHSSE